MVDGAGVGAVADDRFDIEVIMGLVNIILIRHSRYWTYPLGH